MVFVMPERTRVAMGRIAAIGTRVLDWGAESAVSYTMPFSADPDTIRIRTGRTFRPGLRGLWERHASHRFMVAYNALAERRVLRHTLRALDARRRAAARCCCWAGWCSSILWRSTCWRRAAWSLPAGSRVATGGGVKQAHPRTPDPIRADLARALRDPSGAPLPVADVYGMAEAHRAAFQCAQGNYHLPPWGLRCGARR